MTWIRDLWSQELFAAVRWCVVAQEAEACGLRPRLSCQIKLWGGRLVISAVSSAHQTDKRDRGSAGVREVVL
ncbi:uncharacterized protein M421DRAFT_417400 [Didymella exigua CBS 183.55]|uniref:Uncharacterized protein n=1 Tax=Didymella exigua CBS 183.55 TaxID=1150837 RepID=A0A6A5RZF1_9PLEO|nr:uncharacterized protein M421DRAFT_417400 [Didymella exigua CBS 183.55]KAF1931636.1 hypothetical protein M421DRAFT_417400 [Didymella exigua CBS 183.55]